MNFDNLLFWQKLGCTIQYKTTRLAHWRTIRTLTAENYSELNQYRVKPGELKYFHIDIHTHHDRYNTYVVTRIYWRGKELHKTPREVGGQAYGQQVAREWLRSKGVEHHFLRDLECSESFAQVKREADL